MNIKLKINSLSVDAADDIKNVIKHFENKLKYRFKVVSAPLYECIYDIPIDGNDENINKNIIDNCSSIISNTEIQFSSLADELQLSQIFIKDNGSFYEIVQ